MLFDFIVPVSMIFLILKRWLLQWLRNNVRSMELFTISINLISPVTIDVGLFFGSFSFSRSNHTMSPGKANRWLCCLSSDRQL
ncbi:hypothetical protein BDV41DRAFT_552338 [Aspergillus transmontanensis]|uniref:Uncharacterized protein n=1 Tax=Aspergillus transmontanensis TaxID=1034304 RepID=A0A5N6VJ27_9EURO|nr:hypothetical protein BDV41DRAFT_552338 [Aspergillus transmontanensis]